MVEVIVKCANKRCDAYKLSDMEPYCNACTKIRKDTMKTVKAAYSEERWDETLGPRPKLFTL